MTEVANVEEVVLRDLIEWLIERNAQRRKRHGLVNEKINRLLGPL